MNLIDSFNGVPFLSHFIVGFGLANILQVNVPSSPSFVNTSDKGTTIFGDTIGNPVASSIFDGFLACFKGSACVGSMYLNAFGSTIGVLSIDGKF